MVRLPYGASNALVLAAMHFLSCTARRCFSEVTELSIPVTRGPVCPWNIWPGLHGTFLSVELVSKCTHQYRTASADLLHVHWTGFARRFLAKNFRGRVIGTYSCQKAVFYIPSYKEHRQQIATCQLVGSSKCDKIMCLVEFEPLKRVAVL